MHLPPLFNLTHLTFSISAVAILFSSNCFFITRPHPLAAGMLAAAGLLPTRGFLLAPCLCAGLVLCLTARESLPLSLQAGGGGHIWVQQYLC